MNSSTSLVLRTDKRGRVLTPVARREELLAEFDRSGMSAAGFAQLIGVHYQTFWSWLSKRNKQAAPAPRQSPLFVEAVMASGKNQSQSITVRLPGGASIEWSDTRQTPLIAALLHALDKTPSC
jgi:hypothetical protein